MNNDNEKIILSRDCDATLIPFGNAFTLKKGDEIKITQALGGSYTVMTRGSLFRIEAKDADAIGKDIVEISKEDNQITGHATEEEIWEVLKTCYDPEIPVNIVELGLIYDLRIQDLESGEKNILIKMTLTAPGCGMGPVISDEVQRKVNALKNVKNVKVELVWEPQWNQGMMSEAAQLELGMY